MRALPLRGQSALFLARLGLEWGFRLGSPRGFLVELAQPPPKQLDQLLKPGVLQKVIASHLGLWPG